MTAAKLNTSWPTNLPADAQALWESIVGLVLEQPQPDERWRLVVLGLARGVKFSHFTRDFTQPQLDTLARFAFDTIDYLRRGHERDETVAAFRTAHERAKFPLPGFFATIAFSQARTAPLPSAAKRYEDDSLRMLVAGCHELQRMAGDSPFVLTCRDAGREIGRHHETAHDYLKMLVRDGVLEKVFAGKAGSGWGCAAKFRFVTV